MENFTYKGIEYNFIWYKDFTTDILPSAEEYRKSGYVNIHSAFDIETTKIKEDFTTMYIWQFAINDITVIGHTWVEFKELLNTLSKFYKLEENNIKLRVWVQNLNYECSFFRKWLSYKYDVKRKKLRIFATEERKVVYFETENNIEFRDSYILTLRALRDYSKVYKLKHGKLTGDLDYSKIRVSNAHYCTPMENKELAYCIEDVQVLAEWDKVYITREYLRNDKKIPLTSTGILRNEMKERFKKLPSKEKERLKKKLANSYPSENQYNTMIKWLYRGGYVHSNAEYTDDTLELNDMGSYDKKSSYPASALQNDFPWKFVKRYKEYFYQHVAQRKGFNINYDYKLWNKMSFIAVLTFKDIKKTTAHSIESKSKLYDYKNAIFDNGRMMKADECTVVLNEVDFRNYMRFYTWSEVECKSLLVSSKEPLPDYIRDMFLKYFYLKETLEKDTTEYILSKYKVNGLYGLTVTSLYNSDIVLDDNKNLVKQENQESFAKLKSNQLLLPQWGIWISSYSRESELLIHYNCDSAYYGDTDSCKMGNVYFNSQWIEQYNLKLDRINKNMNTGEYDKSIYSELGKFQFEEKYLKFKTLGCKRYLGSYIAFNKESKKYYLKHSVTVAGLPKGALERYAKEKDENIYKLFDFGLSIPKEYSGKKCVSYTDEFRSEVVTDADGVTIECSELSCCTLNDIGFEMKKDEDYIEIVKFAMLNRLKERRVGR